MTVPLVQAPMAGVSSPAMAAAVSNEGGLGSIAVGAVGPELARAMIADVRTRTDRAFNVNVFAHAKPLRYAEREAAWLEWLSPVFGEFDASPPTGLRTIYTSFRDDPAMLAVLLDMRPAVVSFHFGLPPAGMLAALRARGILLLATATSLGEAREIEAAGIDMVVAQGFDAGGHRGIFDPDGPDEALDAMTLTQLLVRETRLPVIAAGGIMDGTDIVRCLGVGAVAAQLGTAFIGCPESEADSAYRAALAGVGAEQTVMTSVISGRPARCLPNRFTRLTRDVGDRRPPDYPVAYDAGKALYAAAKLHGEYGFGAQWAGVGAYRARVMGAGDLVRALAAEMGAEI